MTQPLYSLLTADQTEPVMWTEESQKAFNEIKGSLYDLPALGHSDYQLPFFLFVH